MHAQIYISAKTNNKIIAFHENPRKIRDFQTRSLILKYSYTPMVQKITAPERLLIIRAKFLFITEKVDLRARSFQ